MVVGAANDNAPASDSGSAYIFERDRGGAGNWGQRLKLTASDADETDYFGSSVAISGDTAVVGAQGDKELASYAGAAYIFERDNTGTDAWGERVKLTASDGALWDDFGVAVPAISADTVVVGANWDDSRRGAAYVFERNLDGPDNWGERVKLLASDGAPSDDFGWAVAVSGDVAVVGARWSDLPGQSKAGCAYVFERDAGGAENWGQVRKLVASDAGASDNFGVAVSVDGDVIVVGAYGNDDVGSLSGSAYVFERDQGGAGNWGQVAKLGPGDQTGGQAFGFSVAIDGARMVIGAYGDDEAGSSAGAAYVFEQDANGIWRERQKLLASDAPSGDWFGEAVAVSGGTVAVGARYDDDVALNSGAAYVFGGSTPFVIPGASAPIVVDGKAYVGSSDGRLYEVDTSVAAPAPRWIELGDPAVDKTIGSSRLRRQLGPRDRRQRRGPHLCGGGATVKHSRSQRLIGALVGHLRRARRLAMHLSALSLVLVAATQSEAAEVCVEVSVASVPAPVLIFADGFESGSITEWEDPDPASSFSATGILDLVFELSFVGEVVGDSLVELAVYSPNDHLYQQLSTPVSSLSAKVWSTVAVMGYREPQPVHVVNADTSNGLRFRLPVAGTLIIANSLYGTWTARALVDGQLADCGASLTFEIQQ